MDLLHISDMHFGSRYWKGNNELLLDKINSYSANIVINTGDNTTDSTESEFQQAGKFLASIKCDNVISIPGNHDKRTMRSREFFHTYIDEVEVVRPLNVGNCSKHNLFLDESTIGITNRFTDINFVRKVSVNGATLLVVSLDTNESYKDNGMVDKEMLRSVSHAIEQHSYDTIILLNHHSILETDSDPLFNSADIVDFVRKHRIEHVFCGHTHRLALTQSTDLYHEHSFTQYKNGSLSSSNSPNDSNMFLFFRNFDEKDMEIHVVRIFIEGEGLDFKEEIIVPG